MCNLLVVAVILFSFATLAAAQVPTSGNIFVGFSFENASSSSLKLNLGRPNLTGWEASLEGKVFPHIGIVADFSGHYGSQSYVFNPPGGPGPINVKVTGHETAVLFGPRISVPVGRLTPFGEVMGGVGHINTGGTFSGPSNTSFATAVGGGIDYRVVRPVALRLEGDYVTTRFFSTTQNNLRISTGIVFRF